MAKENRPLMAVLRAFALPIFGGAAGLIIALLILLIGFWRTLLIAVCVAGGVTLGLMLKNRTPLGEALAKWVPVSEEENDDFM